MNRSPLPGVPASAPCVRPGARSGALLRLALVLGAGILGRSAGAADLEAEFHHPAETARPWIYWYWMNAAVSRAGITADLEAMKQAGLGGSYLMPIWGATKPPLIDPPAEQLSPEWWNLIRYAVHEADRLGVKLGLHACDGFAVAGGPWITPELSMQKVVWSETSVVGGPRGATVLPPPPANRGYYRDIAVLAFPSPDGTGRSSRTERPVVTTSVAGVDAGFLATGDGTQTFRSETSAWIQYAFPRPFTCRSIRIRPSGPNHYQADRLRIEVSDDGEHFRSLGRLRAPRAGWQDGDADVTHAIRPTTAQYYRFIYDPAGSEPGSEELDGAKWRPELRLRGIELDGASRLHQFEGKSGAIWRVSSRTTSAMVPDDAFVPLDRIVDVTSRLTADGQLDWDVPAGRWTLLRLGHTSTGYENDTGGAGRGLECDKFNPAAARLQFDRWFDAVFREVGPALAGRVIKIFHVDSWECGSQNWSPVFREEFKRRRGYDLTPYLPAMAGIPVQSAEVSERFLHDLRQTMAELVVDNFYRPLAELAHARGCEFSAETVSATMVSDDLAHYAAVDLPMGEFWLRSATHDKLNSILDAASGAHIYGKAIVQAEAFTEWRLAWDEHPGMLKPLGDRNYAFGVNRFVYHVFAHNPWLDRRPGMTLLGVGTFLQRDQTWWRPGRAWVDYARRCQALLMQGRPVADVAVFTGEEIPRRAVLPEHLVTTLPGIFGPAVVDRETKRLANVGEPQLLWPDGVVHSANLADPADWVDPLHGYAYDSINRDALLRLATVRHGRIVLPGGASYGLLVLPGPRPLSPNPELLSPEVAARVRDLVAAGATVLMVSRPTQSPSLQGYPAEDATVRRIAAELWPESGKSSGRRTLGAGRVIRGPYREGTFDELGLARDFVATEAGGRPARGLAWTHRAAPGWDLYFIANQFDVPRSLDVSLRVSGRRPELWDAVTGEIRPAHTWRAGPDRTDLPLRLAPGESTFVVLREPTTRTRSDAGPNWLEPRVVLRLEGAWQVAFDPAFGGPKGPVRFGQLDDWSTRPESAIRHYSGTATYGQTFAWSAPLEGPRRIWLELGRVADLAEVTVNGVACGVAWTAPWRVEITSALRTGENRLEIAVTNTWANRLIGDHALPEVQRLTATTAPYTLADTPLRPAGLLGPLEIVETW